ncbi:proprotein convertase subtilisin/kexin type 5 [Chanos chanos]|uniref:Proprotein convertase subtilisin/kexin type 5 n=1 Tax=Chanos chanos TaxID=29144 RepID=A0A6J2UPG7_CHACN|nr:proprotein convertase subtilisin/kexin type 5-like [Chanos chanos]
MRWAKDVPSATPAAAVAQEECELCDDSCRHCSGAGPEHCLTCHPEFALHAIDGRCMRCCQSAEQDREADGDCCLCDTGSALCLEVPIIGRGWTANGNLSSQALQHASVALPTALMVALLLALVVFALVRARASRKLCWRQSYERLSGLASEGVRPAPHMPHGVPEPEDGGEESDVVYTSRNGSVYRRCGFIHEPDTEEEEEINEYSQLNRA